MSSCSTLGDSKGPKNSTSISKSGCIMSSVPLMSKSRQNRWASCKSHALQLQQLSSLLVIHFHICFTELNIYHLSFFHHTVWPRHCWSLQFAGRVLNMNLVYGLALHEFSVVQVDRAPARRVWEVIGSNPVGDSEFFFAPRSWHASFLHLFHRT